MPSHFGEFLRVEGEIQLLAKASKKGECLKVGKGAKIPPWPVCSVVRTAPTQGRFIPELQVPSTAKLGRVQEAINSYLSPPPSLALSKYQ